MLGEPVELGAVGRGIVADQLKHSLSEIEGVRNQAIPQKAATDLSTFQFTQPAGQW
jgi:hypothetical protein